jgi:hypothetical protein
LNNPGKLKEVALVLMKPMEQLEQLGLQVEEG